MFWIILISFFAALFLWILIGPVIIYLDTEKNRYSISLPGIFRAAAIPADGLFLIRVWFFFIPFNINPFRKRAGIRKKKPGNPEKQKRSKRYSGGLKSGMAILRSFRIRKLKLNLDTDDFIVNTQLVPVFSSINSKNIMMQVNFEGEASLELDLRTRLGALIWAFLSNR
jgi:hypothetical protein